MNAPTERYVELQGLATGPYTAAELIAWASERRIAADSRVFDPQTKEWRALAADPELAKILSPRLNLADFTELEPVRHEPPPAKKVIPWREKKKKFWEVRRAEEKIQSLISTYNTKAAIAKEKRAAEAAAKAAEAEAKSAEAREAAATMPTAASRTPVYGDFLPSRPANFGEARADSAKTPTSDQNAMSMLEDLLRVDPAPAIAAGKTESEGIETYPESNFHKVLFFGFLLLSALFGGVSLWLGRSTDAPVAAKATAPLTPVIRVGIPGEAPEKTREIVPAGLEVIRAGEIVRPKTAGEPPTSVSAAPRPIALKVVRAESVPALKPPVRPKRD